jgi:four helix bundle protein
VVNDFKELRAYQLSRELAARIYVAVERWRYVDQRTVGLQIIRGADSVGANIAEATGRWHNADQRRLLLIARGSLKETEHWILDRPMAEIARLIDGLIKKRL